jgi:hypothetical protein
VAVLALQCKIGVIKMWRRSRQAAFKQASSPLPQRIKKRPTDKNKLMAKWQKNGKDILEIICTEWKQNGLKFFIRWVVSLRWKIFYVSF